MKQHFLGVCWYRTSSVVAFLILFLVVISGTLAFCLLQQHGSVSLSRQTRYISASSQYFSATSHLIIAGATPTPSDQSAQQVAVAQNDLTIANSLITWASVFITFILAIVTLIGAIAGFLGFRELRNIRSMRDEIEERIKNVNELEQQLKEQRRQLDQRFESDTQAMQERLQQFENSSQGVKDRLAEIVEQVERESQILVEVSYNFNQGIGFYRRGDNTHAVESYQKALNLQPTNVRVLERLGKAYHYLNDTKQAILYLEKALSIDPHHVATLRSLALCYRDIDLERGIQYLLRNVDLDPNSFEALDYLGLFHRDLGKFDEAIQYHEKALKIKQRPETEFYLSILYCHKGDKRSAEFMAFNADYHSYQQEHDERMRPVWKYLTRACYSIIKGHKAEALLHLQEATKGITVQHLYDAVMAHLQLLLNDTDNADWLPECQDIIQIQPIQEQNLLHSD